MGGQEGEVLEVRVEAGDMEHAVSPETSGKNQRKGLEAYPSLPSLETHMITVHYFRVLLLEFKLRFSAQGKVGQVGDSVCAIHSQGRPPWRSGRGVSRRAQLPGESWPQTTSS